MISCGLADGSGSSVQQNDDWYSPNHTRDAAIAASSSRLPIGPEPAPFRVGPAADGTGAPARRLPADSQPAW